MSDGLEMFEPEINERRPVAVRRMHGMGGRPTLNANDLYEVIRTRNAAENVVGMTSIRCVLYPFKAAAKAHRAAQALAKALAEIEAEADGKS